MDHSYFLPVVEQYIRPTLGAKVANQFIRAIQAPSDEFNDRFLWRHLSNICISDTVREPGRTHRLAHEIRDDGIANWSDLRQQVTYFTNTMVLAKPLTDAEGNILYDDRGRIRWDKPSHRVVGGFPFVFTVEFDIPDLEFVKTQMGWCRSSKNPMDAPLGGLYRELSRYGDFMGITACWSGNKSLHLHIMFDSYPIVDRAGLDRRAMREGFTAHWQRAVDITKAMLETPPGIDPDAALDLPESFRRIPWGTRIIGRDSRHGIPKPNILGMPVGMKVPQVTLWEQYRGHRAAAADELFFQPAPFLRTAEQEGRKHGVGSRAGTGAGAGAEIGLGSLTEEERVYCESRLRQHCERKWGAWPKLYRLEWNGSNWVASFYNSQHDGRASSIIRDDYAHLRMRGRDAWKDRSPPPLDFRLGVLMALWLKDRRTSHDLKLPDPDPDDLVTWIDPVRSRPLSEVELAFQAEATGPDLVPDLTRRAVVDIVRDNTLSYIKGPEGSGKTTGLIAEFDQIVRAAGGQEKLHMMAFGNYDAAAEKAREFNSVQNPNGYHAVVVASWIREYRDVCRKHKVEPLTLDDALADGYASLWAMVYDRQPRMIKALEQRHREVWREVGRRRPVFMTSHALMQNWTKYSHSRAFWHRDFWRVHKGSADRTRMAALRTDMQLGVSIHDEVAAGDLLDIHRREVVEWVRDLKRDYPSWRRPGETLEKSRDFIEALAVRGKPAGTGFYHGRELDIDFQTCRVIAEGSDKAWREIVVQDSGEYGETTSRGELESIYQKSVGNRWMVRPRNWWAGVARRVVILTTELVPTVIAGCLPEVKVLGRGRNDRQVFRIVELECPLIPRDTVRLWFDRGCTAKGVNDVIKRFRDQHGDDFTVISDKARESLRTMTHARAKGSNGLIGQDLAQTMIHMGPEEHEMHEVLNAWAGVKTCVKFRHVDAFNQTAGRNLGFRKRGVDPHHWLILSVSLWSKLDEVLCRESRYDFALWLSQNERREIRRRQAEAELQQAESDLPDVGPRLTPTTPARLAHTEMMDPERPSSELARSLEVSHLISVLLSRTSNSNLLNKEAI